MLKTISLHSYETASKSFRSQTRNCRRCSTCFRQRLADGALPYKPEDDQSWPSRYFGPKALNEFTGAKESDLSEKSTHSVLSRMGAISIPHYDHRASVHSPGRFRQLGVCERIRETRT
ncbi:beta-glucanase (GH16 family) [Nitrobacteraceae bacterium AZCC 1564]